MEYIGKLDKKILILITRADQAKSIVAATQSKNLLPGVKNPVPEDFKGKIDGETIVSLIHQCELYFFCKYLMSIYKPFLQKGYCRDQHTHGL